MAVYNVDAINENLNESKKNDSLIDSLEEACDYMMGVIDESKHGNAYRRYMNMQADKQDEELEKGTKLRYIANNGNGNISQEARNKADSHDDNARRIRDNALGYEGWFNNKYATNDNNRIRDAIKDDDYASKKGYHHAREDVHKARSAWKKDHGDTDVEEEKKPGLYKTSEGLSKDHEAKDQKKKAIKETCLYILSVLDEI